MDNHNDHHESPKPSNKWIATPILLAFFTIAALVTFLSFASGTCCGGECKDKAKTEEHGTEHGVPDHDTQSENEEMLRDTSATTSTDSAATNEGEGQHQGHGEGDGHGH